MVGSESWIYQGRQSHGWFGHGTAPHDASLPDAASAGSLAERIRSLGHTLVAGLPRAWRHHDAARLDAEDHARLDRLLTATVGALPLGERTIAGRVFGMHPDAPALPDLLRAARLVRDAHGNADLRAATDAVARAALAIGLDRFKRFLRRADDHLAEQGGLVTLVRDMPGTMPIPLQAEPALPPMGRIPLGPAAAGWTLAAAPLLREWLARSNVREVMGQFHLDASKPADVVAASAFLWAEFHGAFLFDTPQSGPALEAMAERVMRLAQANRNWSSKRSAATPQPSAPSARR